MYSSEILSSLQEFYKALDAATSRLNSFHGKRLKCSNGCHSCCTDELEVLGIEAANIREHYGPFLSTNTPHPIGKCAFLNEEGSCRIYNQRPFVCRTHGVPLRWLDFENKEPIEYRDICELNSEGTPIEKLKKEECLSANDWEEYLVKLQIIADKGEGERVKLRDLFKAPC